MTATAPPPAPSRPRRRRGRVQGVIGLGLMLAGLSLFAYVAWQYFGTNVVAKQRQAVQKEIIAQDWAAGEDSSNVGLIRVPRFGRDYEQPIVRGFDAEALASGVGWDTNSSDPGQVGNFAIAGHRVTHGEPFSKFPELKAGDTVEIETRTHIYTYKLRNSGVSTIVPFTVSWPLWPVPDPDAKGAQPAKALLTMVTCSELFHTDNRSVVIGDLVKDVDKTDPQAQASS